MKKTTRRKRSYIRPSKKKYEEYVKKYQEASEIEPMKKEPPLYSYEAYKNLYRTLIKTTKVSPERINQKLVNSQKMYSKAKTREGLKFARFAWDILKSGDKKIFEEFKQKFSIANKKAIKKETFLKNYANIIAFLKEKLGYDDDDIDDIFSPKEEE